MDKDKLPTQYHQQSKNQTIDMLKTTVKRAEEQHTKDLRKIIELEKRVLNTEEELEVAYSHEQKLLQAVEAGANVVMEMNKNIHSYREKVKTLTKLLSECVSISDEWEDQQEAANNE